MKKAFLFVLILLALAACKGNLEEEAQKQMAVTVDQAGGKSSGIETIYTTDAICIIHLNGERRGKYYRLEYVYILDKKEDGELERWEMIRDLDKEKSIMEVAKEHYDLHDWTEDSYVGKLPERERKDAILMIQACINAYWCGHKIGKKKKVYNPDNW